MKLNKYIVVIIALSFFFGCKKTDTTQPDLVISKTILDVSYGSDVQQTMDVYLPPNRNTTSTKVLVMIHGGGWTGGDKNDFAGYVDTMKRRLPNYAIFNINYRLAGTGTNLFPTQESDVKSAIEFIFSKQLEYHISDKFALLGASAGGHLALLEAYKNVTPVKMKAVVDFFGPADMTEMYNNPTVAPLGSLMIANVMGVTPTTDTSHLYQKSSPINYIDSTSAPTLVFHGGADPLVRKSQSDSLVAKLDSANVIFSYTVYPSAGHGWVGADLFDSFNRIQNFLVDHVN